MCAFLILTIRHVGILQHRPEDGTADARQARREQRVAATSAPTVVEQHCQPTERGAAVLEVSNCPL